jgi:hypothetical protein
VKHLLSESGDPGRRRFACVPHVRAGAMGTSHG